MNKKNNKKNDSKLTNKIFRSKSAIGRNKDKEKIKIDPGIIYPTSSIKHREVIKTINVILNKENI